MVVAEETRPVLLAEQVTTVFSSARTPCSWVAVIEIRIRFRTDPPLRIPALFAPLLEGPPFNTRSRFLN